METHNVNINNTRLMEETQTYFITITIDWIHQPPNFTWILLQIFAFHRKITQLFVLSFQLFNNGVNYNEIFLEAHRLEREL